MKATIEMNGMVHETREFEGKSPKEIISKFNRIQDLDCLVRMGPMYGDDVSELETFMDKYHSGNLTFEDLKNMDISLSIGTIKCIAAEE